jgi:hypothetical protein
MAAAAFKSGGGAKRVRIGLPAFVQKLQQQQKETGLDDDSFGKGLIIPNFRLIFRGPLN